MINIERRKDISDKLRKMGASLVREGSSKHDYCITHSGIFLLLCSENIMDDEDTYLMNELALLFISKKIVERTDISSVAVNTNYEEILKQIIDLKNGPDEILGDFNIE